ncbi:MAG: YbaK/EbsC family protein [Actinomycetota bacterium]
MTELKCAERVRRHLTERGVSYELTEHREAFTAQEMAAALHVPGARVAKAVMLMVDGRLAMAVLAAPDYVGLTRAREALGAGEVRLATEAEFAPVFPDCDLGAAPPFGALYGVPTYLDRGLLGAESIVFAAGSHRHSMRMGLAAYCETAEPTKADLTAR